jgi:hypothetical protein
MGYGLWVLVGDKCAADMLYIESVFYKRDRPLMWQDLLTTQHFCMYKR